MGKKDLHADVIVIGGGVSGCACAAVLAEAGAQVLVVSSSLDVAGLPGYGPELVISSTGWGRVEEVFSELPAPLAAAWLQAASVSKGDHPLMIVDRRAVSIETKRLLELMPGLRFRQGLVVDVRTNTADDRLAGGEDGATVEVETAFGEVLRSRAAVLAVGMGLGGVLRIGGQTMPGGRYGEVPADDLRTSLERAGASFREVEMHVGGRYGSGCVEGAPSRMSPEVAMPRKGTSGNGRQGSVTVRDWTHETGTPVKCDREARTPGGSVPMLPIRDLADSLREGDPSGAGRLPAKVKQAEEQPAAIRMALLLLQKSTSGDQVESSVLVGDWPTGAPPAPHKSEGFVPPVAAVVGGKAVVPECEESVAGAVDTGVTDGEAPEIDLSGSPVLVPDGIATLEFYEYTRSSGDARGSDAPTAPGASLGMMVSPNGSSAERSLRRDPASRLAYAVCASVLSELDEGRVTLVGPSVWATGRVAGATDYLDSLGAAYETARRILAEVPLAPTMTSEGGRYSGAHSGLLPESSTGKSW